MLITTLLLAGVLLRSAELSDGDKNIFAPLQRGHHPRMIRSRILPRVVVCAPGMTRDERVFEIL